MSDVTPPRIAAKIDRIEAPEGRSHVQLGSPIRFANDADRIAFLAYLGVSGAGSGEAIGTIKAWPSDVLPEVGTWVLCDGAVYNNAEYPEAAALIGMTFAGDAETFGVPDIKGRVIAGKGGATAGVLTVAGSGIEGDTLGAYGGEESHALISNELPAAGAGSGAYIASGADVELNGASTPHNNVQPTIVLNWIIKLAD